MVKDDFLEHDLIIAIAGLLHDIGKFAQRADVPASRNDEDVKKDYKYKHALLTWDFVQQYLPAQWVEKVKPLAAHHHLPTNADEKLIRLADLLASSERSSRRDDAAEDHRKVHPKQLLSIFCSITTSTSAGNPQMAPKELYLPIKVLQLKKDTLFPANPLPENRVWSDYSNLWKSFCDEAQKLHQAHQPDGDLETYLETLLLLLQRFTWCIPAAYFQAIPDISLYDHARITAALAVCLRAHSEEQISAWLNGNTQGPAPAALIGGDISGVQKFIYTITSRGAASALRGRSLYLQLLTEAVARFVLRRLELPITNLVQCGGGHFYLLARASDLERIQELQAEVSRRLLAAHSGDLYLVLEGLPIAIQEFEGKALSGKWSKLNENIRQAKLHKFSELGAELQTLVFEPRRDQGNQEKECQVCGREHPNTKPDGEGDRAVRKCPLCLGFEELGDDLRRANYLSLRMIEPKNPAPDASANNWQECLGFFGVEARLFDVISGFSQGNNRSVVLALRDAAMDQLSPRRLMAIGRRFLANVTPILTDTERQAWLKEGKFMPDELPAAGSVKPFEVLEADSRSGFKRLGVLRMDVDDMGKIISEGFGNRNTFSRLASLSFMVNLYFEGWASELARKYNREGNADRDRVYSIYSGGDDLFFVGAWDVMPELALSIREHLTDFAAGHPGIHCSAGLVLIQGKYPLYQAAEDAGQALDEAKNYSGKDSLTFLKQTVPWTKFKHEIVPTTAQLSQLIKSNQAPRSLLTRLQQFHDLYLQHQKNMLDRGEGLSRSGQEQVLWGPWNWRAAYFLKRLARHSQAKQQIEELADKLSLDNFSAIEWIGLAARWADLKTR